MPKSKSKKKEDIIWKINCDNPTPLAFYRFVKPTHHNHADRKYRNTLNLALDGDYKQDWEIWMQEKRAVQLKVRALLWEINVKLTMMLQLHQKKKSKVAEYFEDMRNRNIFILCEPFRKLSKWKRMTYLHDLLSGNIESTLSKVEKPLGSEKTWSNQTIYRIFDLFSMFFNELVSGVSFGEVVNEAHKDRIYNINADQKPSSTHRGDRNDAIICQDENATVLYKQSFGPTEFDETHYLGDMTKLARNGVDDINYQFLQYRKSTIKTAKKLKSIGIHGYKYFISIYLTDLISCKTYRIYEILKCKIPISFTDRWLLIDIVKIGVLLEALLVERKSTKEKMVD
ncbi:hypothetical protein GLOIN_2v1604429 [Rhizophagus clarus]|uniref:Uncharacterized protein n=1 Tax=Rhizophagus clarus TaxID=94130 RepID=A0A8H3MAS3_9GLOM|nr:hypothetical protein GLOIN_2v1604429 [Rhizophagus clarus]